ncbi:hypothetical protein QAD02_015301 [Eretmocerus hayati]|uniref:Uncharacterized protein n=1 Tax=Eretmocerus hayati TaxID=131215 RepID=A0ACC2P894_9HYME|nr:hypothetical protein QAD02_015301 [Eretmocerus hayati]
MDELLDAIAKNSDTSAPASHLKSKYGPLIERVFQGEENYLRRVIDSKNVELVKLFLEFCVPPNRSDARSLDHLLCEVAKLDDFELSINIARLLINAGANISKLDGSHKSSYQYAAEKGNIQLLHPLLNSSSDVDCNSGYLALIEAIKQQNVPMAIILIDAIKMRLPLKDLGRCLHFPIYNNAELVQLLIDSGAPTDHASRSRRFDHAFEQSCIIWKS